MNPFAKLLTKNSVAVSISFAAAISLSVPFAAYAQKGKKIIATRDQARVCLKQEQVLAELKVKGEDNQRINLALAKEAEARSKILDELQAKVDRTDAQQVDDFNAKTKEHNAFVATVNQQAAAMKADTDSRQSLAEKFNEACTNLIVTGADRKAIANEK